MKVVDKGIETLTEYERNPRKNDAAVKYEIYGMVNHVNGKMYIGQTKQGYLKRFYQHTNPSDRCPALAKAMKKYGAGAFTCELLDVACDQETANEKEKMWIALLKTYKSENGYNLSMGGQIGHFNEETLQKMSESHKGEKNHFYGKTHSEAQKRKWSLERKGKYKNENHPRAKSVLCVETGKVYSCVKVAAEDTGVNNHHIGQAANHKYGRKTAGGYHWEWVQSR